MRFLKFLSDSAIAVWININPNVVQGRASRCSKLQYMRIFQQVSHLAFDIILY
jgi:hypothetical protein